MPELPREAIRVNKYQSGQDLFKTLTPEAVPIPDWQKAELDRRKTNLMKNPASGLTWEEVKHRVRGRHGG